MSMATTPSLSMVNTPTTTASSSSLNSMYDFTLRRLPPRHDPMYSASASVSRGVDLVTPHVAPPSEVATSFPTYDHDFWGKKVVVKSEAPKEDGIGLGALFARSK
jgi:hypothetical protein